MDTNETTNVPDRYGPPGRDSAERPKGAKRWLLTEAMPSAWVPLYANADPSGLEDDSDWPLEMAERAEARYAAEGYTFSGTTCTPDGGWEDTDADGNPRPPEEPFDDTYEGVFGTLQNVIWTNAAVLENDLAAGKRPYLADGAEYLLDATRENAVWLPACWWRLIEHGEWKASDFDDDEDEEHWGAACAREVLAGLHHDGWTPVRRLGNGYVERSEQFHGYKGELTLYLLRRELEPKPIPPIYRDR